MRASHRIWRCCVLLLSLTLFHFTPARAEGEAYLHDTQGGYVRNSDFGDRRIGLLCWRTGYWTPAQAVAACEPDLMTSLPNSPPPSEIGYLPSQPPPTAPCVTPAYAKETFDASVFFDFDKSVLKPGAKIALDALMEKIAGINPEVLIAVGHTDGIGGDAYNNKLSTRRGEAVKAYLVSRGVEPNRIYVEGRGKRAPIADNRTAEGRAKNRRVEVEVVGTPKSRSQVCR